MQIVHLYVTDTLADWEPGYAIAALNNDQWQRRPGRYAVRTVGATLAPVTTMGGVRIQPDTAVGDVSAEGSALLLLPGANTWDDPSQHAVLDKARQFLDAGVPIAGICGATWGLARAGLLDEREHTSNDRDWLASSGYAGARLYRDAPAVTDHDVITAGSNAPLEFAREILDRLDVYEPPVLDAWYGLYSTGDPSHWATLAAAS